MQKPILLQADNYQFFSSHSNRRWSGRCFTLKCSNVTLNPFPSGQVFLYLYIYQTYLCSCQRNEATAFAGIV